MDNSQSAKTVIVSMGKTVAMAYAWLFFYCYTTIIYQQGEVILSPCYSKKRVADIGCICTYGIQYTIYRKSNSTKETIITSALTNEPPITVKLILTPKELLLEL